MHGRHHASFAFESISLVVGSVGDNSGGFAMDFCYISLLFPFGLWGTDYERSALAICI